LKSISLNPYFPLLNITLYKCYYNLEDWENAESCLWYEKNNIIGSSFIFQQLSVFALESNQPTHAIKMIQKAIHLDPTLLENWNILKKIEKAV
jgi:tetratricopeptide (TPR) repeat protein